MEWPSRPTCHGQTWRPYGDRPPYRSEVRTCDYCGSLHPEDLYTALHHGAKLRGSDWKYGFPHKFYVDNISNGYAGVETEVGGTYDRGVFTPTRGIGPHAIPAKWYTVHLTDEGYDDESRDELLKLLELCSGISFFFDDGKLMYRAPYHGYQR